MKKSKILTVVAIALFTTSCSKIISVRTPQHLTSLSIQTYIFAAIAAVVFVLITALISNSIKFEGGSEPRDPKKRKMWFYSLWFTAISSFFLYNLYVVAPTVAINLQSKFMTTNIISTAIVLVVYFVLGFILSKIFSTSKIGNWFPSKK